MTDEDAFLAAIAAAPDDQAPRLVFADWLEERGDPRGAWLRDPMIAPWMGVRCENPIPRLIAELGESEEGCPPNVCESPVLQRIGGPAIPALVEALRSPHDYKRQAVCQMLRFMADDLRSFRPQLEEQAESIDPAVRGPALLALGCLPDEGALVPLIARLESSDAEVWSAALQAVGDLGPAAGPVIPHVMRLWQQEVEARTGTAFRAEAVETLRRIGAPAAAALPLLVGALAHPGLAPELEFAFDNFGQTAVGPLSASLSTLDPAGARLAAGCLVRVAPDRGATVAALLNDPKTGSAGRRALIEVASRMGFVPEVVAAVLAHVRHPDDSVVRAAVESLAAYGSAATALLPELAQAARGRSPDVRLAVVRATIDIDIENDVTRKMLRRGLTDPDGNVRAETWDCYRSRFAFSQAIRDLRTVLRSDDSEARACAVETLGRIAGQDEHLGDDRVYEARATAVNLLIECLDDRSGRVRAAAAGALAERLQSGTEAAFEPLVRTLDDPDPGIRERAAFALSRLEMWSDQAVRVCLRLLNDESTGVVCGALAALGTMRNKRPDVDRRMTPFLRDRSARVRAAAASALSTWDGPPAGLLDDARDLADDRNDAVRAAGLRLLSKVSADELGDRLPKYLGRGLRDSASAVRAAAVEALKGRGEEFLTPLQPDLAHALAAESDPAVADELVTLLRFHCPNRAGDVAPLLEHQDAAVRGRAIRALAGAGPTAAAIVPRLVAEFDNGPAAAQALVLEALDGIGFGAAAAVPVLTGLIDGPPSDLRDTAVRVAGSLEEAGSPLVERLDALARNGGESLQRQAAEALARLAGWCPAAASGVREALMQPDPWVARGALEGLQKAGARGAPFTADVEPYLFHSDPDVRSLTAGVLEKFGPGAAAAVPALMRVLDQEAEWYPRAQACAALGAIGPAAAAAVSRLIDIGDRPATDEYFGNVRRGAIEALGKIADPAGLPTVRRAIFDPDGEVRESVAQALVPFGPAARPALPEVCKALLDKKWDNSMETYLKQCGYEARLHLLDAVEAMRTAADPVLPTLQKLLDDPNRLLAWRAIEVLAGLGADAHPVLRRALKHKDASIRESAREALGEAA